MQIHTFFCYYAEAETGIGKIRVFNLHSNEPEKDMKTIESIDKELKENDDFWDTPRLRVGYIVYE